jgi:hypothetical protein
VIQVFRVFKRVLTATFEITQTLMVFLVISRPAATGTAAAGPTAAAMMARQSKLKSVIG